MNEKEINAITSEAENTEVLVSLFSHAVENLMTDELKEQARRCCEAYYGTAGADGSRVTILMIGFLMGTGEGLRLSSMLDDFSDDSQSPVK